MKKLFFEFLMFFLASTGFLVYRSSAQSSYVPKAVFCPILSNAPCSMLPAYIGPDSRLKLNAGYSGLFGPLPTSARGDVQTPFDNMAWQMFVALNWAATQTKNTPAKGLTTPGPRVWQKYRKLSSLFGNSPVTAACPSALALPVISIGSDGNGNPQPNNEEYFQASTNLPLIDINGNWTVFERRVNDIEASYLLAPNGQASQTLTTIAGQTNFIKNNPKGAQFTASAATPLGNRGSIEIKVAWRILDQNAGDDPSRYFTQLATLAVPGDLVNGGSKICATVTLGLVGMHIIQRNPVDPKNPALLPQWIWATFEHVDNAPMAMNPCSVATGCGPPPNYLNGPTCGAAAPSTSVRYSYYHQNSGVQGTNVAPQSSSSTNPGSYPWNSRPPYAQGATTAPTSMPQATRCWSIYPTTVQINQQWHDALAKYHTPFQNYMLIGAQWGGTLEPRVTPLPLNAVPAMLSNMTLETYIQNYTGSNPNLPGPGSCISCHGGATLPADNKTSANFSFLPFLAEPATARSKIKTAR